MLPKIIPTLTYSLGNFVSWGAQEVLSCTVSWVVFCKSRIRVSLIQQTTTVWVYCQHLVRLLASLHESKDIESGEIQRLTRLGKMEDPRMKITYDNIWEWAVAKNETLWVSRGDKERR